MDMHSVWLGEIYRFFENPLRCEWFVSLCMLVCVCALVFFHILLSAFVFHRLWIFSALFSSLGFFVSISAYTYVCMYVHVCIIWKSIDTVVYDVKLENVKITCTHLLQWVNTIFKKFLCDFHSSPAYWLFTKWVTKTQFGVCSREEKKTNNAEWRAIGLQYKYI